MLKDEIRRQMLDAMRSKDDVAKGILRVALGEVQTAESRSGEDLADAAVEGLLRKLLKSNEETLEATTDDEVRLRLQRENEILRAVLPATLGEDDIIAALAPVLDQVRSAASDGQATGVAMKHLKEGGAAVTGKEVSAAVRKIRSD